MSIINTLSVDDRVSVSHEEYPDIKEGYIEEISIDTETYENGSLIGLTVVYSISNRYAKIITCNQHEVRPYKKVNE